MGARVAGLTLAGLLWADLSPNCLPSYLVAEPDSWNTPMVTVQIIGRDVWTHQAAFASPARCLEAARLLETVLTRLGEPGVTVTTNSGCLVWARDR